MQHNRERPKPGLLGELLRGIHPCMNLDKNWTVSFFDMFVQYRPIFGAYVCQNGLKTYKLLLRQQLKIPTDFRTISHFFNCKATKATMATNTFKICCFCCFCCLFLTCHCQQLHHQRKEVVTISQIRLDQVILWSLSFSEGGTLSLNGLPSTYNTPNQIIHTI